MSRDPSFLPPEAGAARAPDSASAGIPPDAGFHVPMNGARTPPAPPVPGHTRASDRDRPRVPDAAPAAHAGPPAPAPYAAAKPPAPRAPSPARSPAFSMPSRSAGGSSFGGVTLLPGTERSRGGGTGWGIALAVVSVAIIAGMWWFVVSSLDAERVAVETAERADAELRTRAAETTALLAPHAATARRATAVAALLDTHVVWERAFRLLEERTLPSVTYGNFTADTTGAVIVSVTAPDIRTAAEQIAALQATPGLSMLDVGGMASVMDEIGVTRGAQFTLRFRLDSSTFRAFPRPPSEPSS